MQWRVIKSNGDRIRMLAIPPPYRAWLTISNDPDFTTYAIWRQLDEFIWKELALPLADSFFLVNHNESLPEQVDLQRHPEIVKSHPHDTMHTWGDYLQSRKIRFSRDCASEGLAQMQKLHLSPRVWTDHSGFEGNLIHRATHAASRFTQDSAGHMYENFNYTLDLIRQAGVRYVWDGEAKKIIGQDREIGRTEHYRNSTRNRLKATLRATADWAFAPSTRLIGMDYFTYRLRKNLQYERHSFPDDQVFYRFRRFGLWKNADIDGLAESISPINIDHLIRVGGTAVVYTHLGKPKVERLGDAQHIPRATAKALQNLASQFQNKRLMVSGTADLLDYLVLRDHAVLTKDIDFRPDGIRFAKLTPNDLTPFSFGIFSSQDHFRVLCNGQETNAIVEPQGDGYFRIAFKPGEPVSPTSLSD